MRRLFRAVCKAQVTVLRGGRARIAQIFLLKTNDFLLNTNQTDGADGANKEKGGKAERGKRRENEGRRGEGAENERRAKLTKWGG